MRQNSSDQVCQSEVPVWFTGEFTSRTHQSGWLVEFTSALISQASVEGASRTHQIQQAEWPDQRNPAGQFLPPLLLIPVLLLLSERELWLARNRFDEFARLFNSVVWAPYAQPHCTLGSSDTACCHHLSLNTRKEPQSLHLWNTSPLGTGKSLGPMRTQGCSPYPLDRSDPTERIL